jgi:cation:H+ antiporter
LDLLMVILGLCLLVGGGDIMVRGAAALARQLGVPPLAIGLTVVAFGTSTPELAVNVSAAAGGNGTLAFGNLVGSNLANVGLVLAVSALLRPLVVESVVVTREIPMMLLASTATLVMGFDMLRGQESSAYDRSDGVMLLLLFGVFLYYTIAETLRRRSADPLVQQASEHPPGGRLSSLAVSSALVVGGIVGLVAGGQLTVQGAVGVATALGASKGVVGLTVVAVGTSLPELSASLMAARRNELDLAVGNVVGSNVFNLLFVLGVTATIRPVPVPPLGHADLLAMLVIALVMLVLSFSRGRLGRPAGVLLLLSYATYIAWRAASGIPE